MSDEQEPRVCPIDVPATRACEDAAAEPQRRPYRPVPRDFVERWPQFGWSEAKFEWHCHPRTISRWLDECGRDGMILARKAYLDAQRAVEGRSRRKRYVLGRTLSKVERGSE